MKNLGQAVDQAMMFGSACRKIPNQFVALADDISEMVPAPYEGVVREMVMLALMAERDRCFGHAIAPDYGELTPEARAEADRIADRIQSGT
jgi:hypothetical protein